MRRRLVVVLAFAALVGLAASLLVYRVVVQVAAAAHPDADHIVVAAANLGMADTITPQHVRLVAWPRQSVPPGAIHTVAEADGRVVRTSIAVGEPLLDAKLAPQLAGRGGIMPMLVPEGQRGVTIKVDDATRESGFVLPNSRVDVLVSLVRDHTSQQKVAKVILQDVLVLAAGQTVEMRDNKPESVTTVTLSLTPEQAERLALAQQEGRLMLATRNLRDDRTVRTPGATTASLLGDGAAAAPPPVPHDRKPRASAPLPPPRIESLTIAIIRANKASEEHFVRQGGDDTWTGQGDKTR